MDMFVHILSSSCSVLLVVELNNGSKIVDCKITGHFAFGGGYTEFDDNVDYKYVEKMVRCGHKKDTLYFEANGIKGEIIIGNIKNYEIIEYFKFVQVKDDLLI